MVELNGNFNALFDLDWGQFAQTLDGPQFAALRTFELQAPPHDYGVVDAEALVTAHLATLEARSILQVKTQPNLCEQI